MEPKKSRFKGVSWYKRDGKWLAKIQIDSKKTFWGYFVDEEAAARAYDKAAARVGRPLNFPAGGVLVARRTSGA